MDPALGYAVLLAWSALQVPMLWVIVRHFGLRNDDGPRDPVGYSLADGGNPDTGVDEWTVGRCEQCGAQNDPTYEFCRNCLAGL